MNLAQIIESHPAGDPAIISRGKTTTYGVLRQQVAAMRGGLDSLGLRPGDRLGLICGNNWYFVVSYLAALGAGLVVVPLNPSNPLPAMTRELETSSARAVVVGPKGRHGFTAIDRSELPDLEHVIGCDTAVEDAVAIDAMLETSPVQIRDRDDDDLAALMFTSGTAGSPKAAMLTHGNLRSNLEQIQAAPGRSEEPSDLTFGVLPLFHIFGLNVALGLSLYAGSSLLLVERFDPMTALESIKAHEVTIVTGPPTMWAAWASLPEAPTDAFASVRIGGSGASKLPVEVAETISRRFGLDLAEGYGLTEASPIVTSATGTPAPVGSIGVPLPGLEVRLVDADGGDVLIGDAGEIWVRGPNVFAGYWQDEQATSAALTEDGWLRTGDIAVVDDDGYLFVVDRAKDLIIVSGFNVYPAEVEAVLAEHPAVETAAVVGVPHPYSGEAVKAYVVVRSGHSIEEDDVIDFCHERLAGYKAPTKVNFVDDLPEGLGGKVLRRALT